MATITWTIINDDQLVNFFDKVRMQLRILNKYGGNPKSIKELESLLKRIREEIENREGIT